MVLFLHISNNRKDFSQKFLMGKVILNNQAVTIWVLALKEQVSNFWMIILHTTKTQKIKTFNKMPLELWVIEQINLQILISIKILLNIKLILKFLHKNNKLKTEEEFKDQEQMAIKQLEKVYKHLTV
jgi:hypothetical protein